MLIPYSAEVWSNQGVLPDPELNPTFGILPNILNVLDSPFQIQASLVLLTIFSISFGLGYQRPIVALILWYGWACLFNRNNLISNPGIPFIGWVLLACALIPKGEPLSLFSQEKKDWQFPKILWYGAWIIMSLSYTMSGIDKIQSPSWLNGNAIKLLLENPLARTWWLRDFMLSLPEYFLMAITWSILAIEILFAPLSCINLTTRKYACFLMVFTHLGILLLVDFADLTFGMLMIHFFTFDTRWIKDIPFLSTIFEKTFSKNSN